MGGWVDAVRAGTDYQSVVCACATYADGSVGVVGGGGVEERAEVQVQEGEPVLRLHPPACVGGKRSDWRIG